MLVLCASACRAVQKCEQDIDSRRDTLIVERRTVDTLLITAPDSATLSALWECDSLGNVLLAELETAQGKRLNVETRVQYIHVRDPAGNIRRKAYFAALATTDSLQQRIRILEERERKSSAHAKTSTMTKTKTHGWDAPAILLLLGLLVSLVICLKAPINNNDND